MVQRRRAPLGDRPPGVGGRIASPVAGDATAAPVREHCGGEVVTGSGVAVRLLLNVIWLVLAGFWMAVGYAVAALICFILIITIPFGIAALRIAVFALWPFGKTVVRRADGGIASGIGNVIWLVLCGWWLALGHLVTGVLLCLTVIGIPLRLAIFKLIPVSLLPLGREIVDIDELRASGARAEVAVPDDPSRR